MKSALKRFLSFYLDSGWLSAVLFGVLAFAAIAGHFIYKFKIIDDSLFDPPQIRIPWWFVEPFYSYFFKGIALLSGVGFVVALIHHLGNRRWLKALGGIGIFAGFFVLVNIVAYMGAAAILLRVFQITRNLEDKPPEEPQTLQPGLQD
jgi:hypothetical protein